MGCYHFDASAIFAWALDGTAAVEHLSAYSHSRSDSARLVSFGICASRSATGLPYISCLLCRASARLSAQPCGLLLSAAFACDWADRGSQSSRTAHADPAQPERDPPVASGNRRSAGSIGGLWISETKSGCAIHAQKSELVAEQLADIYRLVHEQVLCRPSGQPHALVLWMNDLVIQSPTEAPVAFNLFKMELKRHPQATTGGLRFRLSTLADPVASMTFDRHHDQAEPTSHWTLDTGSQSLPGSWVNRFAQSYAIPGNQSAFTGSFDLAYNQSFWNLQGAGRMHRVDTTAWFERPLLSGLAYVDITRFSLNHHGLNDVAGSLSVKDGHILGELLTAAVDISILPVGSYQKIAKESPAHGLPYQTIEANFQLDNKGLRIESRRPDNIIAWNEVAPIAAFRPCSLIPTFNLVWCLSRSAPNETERTATASRLLQWLPKSTIEPAPANYQVRQE